MQKLIGILFVTLSFSMFTMAQSVQSENYQVRWKLVKEFELKGLPKSALTEVEKIYKKAKTTKNQPQLIKALMYKSKFSLTLEEDAQLKGINALKKEISENQFPTKNILESILADLYWQYFQQNRWKFYNRTKTSEKVDSTDFRTWDLQTLFEETHRHYQKSLENGLQSQQVDLKKFNDILHLQKDSKKFRPTLYDFLAHRAINFYKTDERNLNRPAYKFEIEDKNLLADNSVFIQNELNAKDDLSQQLHALYIYRNLSLFHQKDSDPTALVFLTLERLSFVRSNAVFEGKEDLYLATLKRLKERYQNNEIVTEVDYRIALLLNQQGNSYVPLEKEDQQWKRKEALKICEGAILKFPKSSGGQKCKSLKSQILNKSLRITAEKFIPLNTPSRVLIDYKNMEQLYFSAFEISRKQQQKFNKIYNDSSKIAYIKKLKLAKSWRAELRDEKDYQKHKTEVLLPKMAQGSYLIFAATSKDLSHQNTFAYSFFQATNLALIEKNDNGKYIYQIINRNNGKPVVGASVNLKNYNTNRYNKPYNKTFTTDKKGQIEFRLNGNHYNVVASVNYNDDRAIFGDYYLRKRHVRKDNNNRVIVKSFLFTDRSIYRPGQQVHFKGIIMETYREKSDVLVNENVFIKLYDVNGQEIKELDLKSNEFGSFSGEFILPAGGLTGEYYIEVYGDAGMINNNHYFSVEEYKRPKFETEFKPVTETFKLNDSIEITGSAVAYAGSNITNAKVVYRVIRTAQYPKWYWYYRPYISSEAMEITNGETTTDASGNFEIVFKAIPDTKVKKETQPTFNYQVIADVTDINGETRSTEAYVKVGYHALDVLTTIAEQLDKTKKDHKVTLTTNNLNGEFVAAKGTFRIYKLEAPQNVLRKRPWRAPDYQEFSQEEFSKLFPYEAYKNEDDPKNWKKGKLVFEIDFDTEETKEIELKKITKWLSGTYIAVLECLDKFGQDVKDEQRFNVFSDKDKIVSDKQLFFINTDKTNYKPEEFVKLKLGSASDDITATIVVEKNYNIVDTKIVHLSNDIKTITIPVKQEDIGGFAIYYQLAGYNAFINGTKNISVPYLKHELDIETTTFRDKLQPGQNQTWRFKLKGSKGDKIAAEMLASMYDASLDQFRAHNWSFNPISYQYYRAYNYSNANHSFGNKKFNVRQQHQPSFGFSRQNFDRLNWFGFYFGNSNKIRSRGLSTISEDRLEEVVVTAASVQKEKKALGYAVSPGQDDELEVVEEMNIDQSLEGQVAGVQIENDPASSSDKKQLLKGIVARKNLHETAFFYPHLRTDTEGNVSFNFTVPESLTRWKLQLLAHSKGLASTTKQLTTVTQKELMVLPNPPRFLREGDKIIFAVKIANLTDKNLGGISELQLFDALTNKSIDAKLGNADNRKSFSVDGKGNTSLSWTLQIPEDVQAVNYRILAKAGDFTDGEENALPVLSNRVLVTETLPMWLRSNQTKTFTLDKLKNNTSTTLKNHKLTLEVTSNPAWYAVQALPYLMEYPYECAEQTFSRYYANALASHIANSNPRIQEVFKQWASTDALLSNLEKNQELKSLIIQETPWLRDAQSETEQKKRIALLFDLNKMQNELQSAIRKLKQIQMNNGGFPWFKGSRYPNRYITQHIASGFGHLNKLGVAQSENDTKQMLHRSVQFLDDEILDDYNELKKQARKIRERAKTKTQGRKNEAEFWKRNHTGNFQIQYLYMRSFYKDLPINDKVQKAVDYYTGQSYIFWLNNNLYTKGMIALIAKRNGNATAEKIIASLKENAISSEELGMYWKENSAGWYWYQAPIETQALLIEAFSEIEGDTKTVDALKIWLLKNKQTNRWKTTKATTEAVYALLLQGTDWLEVTDFVALNIGGQTIDPLTMEDSKVEAGTGYFKTSWTGTEVTSEMAEVKMSKKSEGIAWGAMYWQYFEDLDKITSAETPLKLKKKLFLKKNADKGEELSEITNKTNLKLGDLVRVRIELRVDRTMEFVHMKDMRAAGFEPVNVLSQYKWQDNLGYYESTKDAATNFFFDYLPKGVYVFEYDLRVNNKGDFSNGITTIQSMYAPEFSSHSEGVRVKVD